MGLLGSALGRGVAATGEAAAGLASRYIDEEMAAQKAQMLADLQHKSAVKIDQYNLSPERQAQMRANSTAATMEQGQAQRNSELAGLNDKPYQDAVQGKKTADAAADTEREITKLKAMTPAQVEAMNAKTKGTMGIEAQREALIADARERAKYNWDDRRSKLAGGGDALKLPPGVKATADRMDDDLKQINAAIVRAQADGNWDPERNPSQKQLIASQRATQLRYTQLMAPYLPGAKPAGADPLGIMADQPAAPGAPAAQAKPAEAPKKAEGPSFWDRAVSAVGGAFDRAQSEGSAYTAIEKRWREAGAGGPPLTEPEKAQARAFGLAVR